MMLKSIRLKGRFVFFTIRTKRYLSAAINKILNACANESNLLIYNMISQSKGGHLN
jgi:hypothetical protein